MKVDKSLLAKYHSGQCNAHEREQVEAWLCSEEWPEECLMQVPNEESLTIANVINTKKRSWNRQNIAIGIAAMIICTVGMVFYDTLTTVFTANKGQQENLANTLYHTDNGKKMTVKLNDGTEVIINAASTLYVPHHFTDSSRVVRLEGEAYFSVAKDKKRPFTILSDNSKVTVLGTEFNLKAYPRELTELDVQEGRVAFTTLKNDQQPLILIAGERATLHPQTGVLQRIEGYTASSSLWKDGGMAFENVSLQDIAQIIARRFDYKVTIKDNTLAQQHYTGSFKEVHIHALLAEISFVLGCNYNVKDREIIFYK